MDAHTTAIADAMAKLFGEEPEEQITWLDLGYAPLNKLISGHPERGLAGGRMYEIAGPSASGKTLLATMAMIAAQRAGGYAIFVDWERAFNKEFAAQLGLDTSRGRFLMIKAETWESGNTQAMQAAQHLRASKLIPESAPIVAVFDSIAAAVPNSVLYDSKTNKLKDIDSYSMNDTTALARVTSTTLKAINQLVAKLGVTAIYLNQIRTKPGVVYGDPTTTPGGGAMEFYATTRIFTGRKKLMEGTGSDKELVGVQIGMETKKNKLTRPFQSTDLRLMYEDSGMAVFDFATGYVEELVAAGKLEEKAGRVTWEGKTYWKVQLSKKLTDEGQLDKLKAMFIG
jgi:protein RecA